MAYKPTNNLFKILGVTIAAACLFFYIFMNNKDLPRRAFLRVKGQLIDVHLQTRQTQGAAAIVKTERWGPGQTAIIVIDMWDQHWHQCRIGDRIQELAPAINCFLVAARKKNILVIHAPSDVVWHYESHPARKKVQKIPQAKGSRDFFSKESKGLPIESREEGQQIDALVQGCSWGCVRGQPWTQQNEVIKIKDHDLITAKGGEIWSILEFYGIKNIIVVGVHADGCILSRSFGLHNLVRSGKRVVLCRDLTDVLYDDQGRIGVHAQALQKALVYIEENICPTMLSSDITYKPSFQFVDR